MKFLPKHFETTAEKWGWSRSQSISMIALSYADVAIYGLLLLLALRNVWVVVPQHYKELKMLPSIAFYSFAVLALSLRPLFIIGKWTDDITIYVSMDYVQQGAKLCVGLVQDWITFELAVRMHISNSEHGFSPAHKDRLHAIFRIVYVVLALALIAWIVIVIVSAHLSDDGLAFSENDC